MKILTVSNSLLRSEDGSGGIILGYSNGLRELGHEVILKGPDDYEIFRQIRPRANTWRQMIGMYAKVPQWVDEHRPDIVEFYGAEGGLAIQRLKRRRHRPLLIHHTNGPEIRYGLPTAQALSFRSLFQRRYIPVNTWRKSFTEVDRIVTVSKTDEAWLLKNTDLVPSQIKAIENPIDEVFFDHGENRADSDHPIIGFCGSWIPRKGIDVMGKDISAILQEYPKVRFRIVGAHAEFRPSDYFASNILDRVESLGIIRDKKKLREFYCRCSLFVMPSTAESFGLSLVEAMACGCAVVAGVGVGFASTLTDGKDALIMNESKSPLLYLAVKQLLEDQGLRSRVASSGCLRVQGLRWKRAVSELAEIYEKWKCEHRS